MQSKKENTFEENTDIPSVDNKCRYIKEAIDIMNSHSWINKFDLTYFLKEILSNGKIYISRKAYLNYKNDIFNTKTLKSFDKEESVNLMLEHKQQKYNLHYKINSNALTYEHATPTKVLIDILVRFNEKNELSDDKIKEIISTYGNICIITNEEDKLLNKYNLREKMPSDWNYGDDPFSRYKKVGIEIM